MRFEGGETEAYAGDQIKRATSRPWYGHLKLTFPTHYSSDMKLVTVHIPEVYLAGLEKLVELELYPNRSEAIRVAIRDLLKAELGAMTTAAD
ncbi:MAG: hypothetical protein Kow0069_01420 [Promethearchaeota archaeon]